MRVADLLATGALDVPWTMSIDGKELTAHRELLSDVCAQKCPAQRACATADAAPGEHLCAHGMTFFRVIIYGEQVTVFGMRGPANPNATHPKLKQHLKGRSLDFARVVTWAESIQRLITRISDGFLERQSEMLDPLHDPMRLSRQIEAIAARLLSDQFPGRRHDEQISLASRDLKSLVKAAGLLSDSFDLLTIYFNPAAASFGRKSYISLHGLLVKLVSILEIKEGDEGHGHDVHIYLSGQSFRRILVHESFKLVPFALISNAVKYSLRGNVRVEIIERTTEVEVAVESVGPYIEPDEIGQIFNKRVRGRWAREVTDGTGVGLYLARIVAVANGFDIRASSSREGTQNPSGIPLANNRFSFVVRLGSGS